MWTQCYQVVYINPFVISPIQVTTPFNIPIVESIKFDDRQNNQTKNQEELKSHYIPTQNQEYKSQIKEEIFAWEELPQNTQEDLLKVIKLILSNINDDTKVLEKEIYNNFDIVKIIGKQFFINFINKLKKLTKTKQQAIKYCVRKALRFINQKLRNDVCLLAENDILRQLIEGMNQGYTKNIPFKRHSHFKTMNSSFLKKLFSSSKFTQVYEQFLDFFPKICQLDNNKKIQNFIQAIISHLETHPKDFRRFNNFKRIPWTNEILNYCYQVAKDLQKYAPTTIKQNLIFE